MEIFYSTIIYILTYFISAFCLHVSVKNKRHFFDIWFIISVLCPFFLATFRVNTGTDYQNYIYIYERNSQLSFTEWVATNRGIDDSRIGIWLLSKIASLFGTSQLFFGITALIIYCPIAYLLKKYYSQIAFLAAFAFLFMQFSTGLNIIKQVLAISILVCGLRFITERKLFKYVLVVAIAMCFHITAVVGLLMYFLYGKTAKGKLYGRVFALVSVIGGIILLPQISNLLGGRFGDYIIYNGEINNRSFYLDLVFAVLFLSLRKKYLKLDKRNDLFIFMFLIGTILETTGFISPFIKRIASFFTVSLIILLPQIPLMFKKEERNYIIFLIAMYFIVQFILAYGIMGQSELIPYKMSFEIKLKTVCFIEFIALIFILIERLTYENTKSLVSINVLRCSKG